MATPNFGWDNKFSTTLSSGVTASDTTIPLTNLPSASEGYLVIEPDSSTAWEEIYFTSKTGSAVVCPSVAAGRGVGGSTAASHSSGATVREDSTAEMFEVLQDTTAMTGLHTQNTERGFDHVASGGVWTGDSLGSTRAASMTSGVAYINGRRHTFVAVTSRTFTASKDTYVDLLYSTVDNIATPVYTEATNNAASPALASNSIRVGIVVTGATTIAAAGSINQGQENIVLPIASSIAYTTTDSLGNLICPRDSTRKTLGYRQITGNFTTASTSAVQITGLTVPVLVPTGRKIVIRTHSQGQGNSANAAAQKVTIWDGTVGSGTQLDLAENDQASLGFFGQANAEARTTPAASSKTYNIGFHVNTGTGTFLASATGPAFVSVELA